MTREEPIPYPPPTGDIELSHDTQNWPIKRALTAQQQKPTNPPSPTGINPNSPPRHPPLPLLLKFTSAGLSFFTAGINDGSLGALTPHITRSYGISLAVVSALYAATFLGWLSAALVNAHLSQRLTLGSMLLLGASLQVLSHALRCWGPPPFPLYVVSFWVASLGQAMQDAHANTFVTDVGRPGSSSDDSAVGQGGESRKVMVHRWLGFIHAMYAGGMFVAPFAAAPIGAASRGGDGGGGGTYWYLFYTVPLGVGVVNVLLVIVAFRDSIGVKWGGNEYGNARRSTDDEVEENSAGSGATALIKGALSHMSVWLLSMFYFFYLGTVVTAGGWVVEYLVSARDGDVAEIGYVSAGFNGGTFLGRVLLPEPTHRFGERRMMFIYCVLCLGFQLVFWLVPNIIAASVVISFFGFLSGPFFSTGMSVAAKILPPDISATAVSFVFVFGQIGGSLFPIVTGLLGAYVGVSVMQPILVALITATGMSWLLVPQVRKTEAQVE